jgi:uncharacterized protein (TIGR03437 family)
MRKRALTHAAASVAALVVFCANSLVAQTAEEVIFQAVMLPENVAPAITNPNLSATATILVNLVRNSAGQVTSGTLTFAHISVRLTGSATLTAIHIHRGATGVNGPVVAGVVLPAGQFNRTGNFFLYNYALGVNAQENDLAGLEMLQGLLPDPTQFYIDVDTAGFPDGAMRGQLRRAERLTFLAQMSPANVVPPIADFGGSGAARVQIHAVRDASGSIISASGLIRLSYSVPQEVTFTSMHIHPGAAGVNGPITIGPFLPFPPNGVVRPSGNGILGEFFVDLLNNAAGVQTVAGMFNNPGDYYIDLHTTAQPDGAMHGQLRRASLISFPVTMLPSNVVPPVSGLAASVVGRILVHALWAEDGSVVAATVSPNVNVRFPGRTEFTGIHIHEGAAGVNGPLGFTSGGGTPTSPTVYGTGFGLLEPDRPPFTDAPSLATLNSLLQNPQNYYIDWHTTANPDGAVRAQLGTVPTAVPALTAGSVLSAVLDRSVTSLAPLGLFTIFGTNLAGLTTDLTGGDALPAAFGGVTVDVGGKRARLLYVSPNQINGQLLQDTPSGLQQVIVNNGSGASPTVTVTVAPTAPAIFFGSTGGAVLKNADFSLVGPSNPARAGDVLLIFFTGAGQTNPPIGSGSVVKFPPLAVTAPVRVTIGAQIAEVLYSAASPGFVGLYQASVRMPSGVLPSNAPVILGIAGVNSNTVTITVQ